MPERTRLERMLDELHEYCRVHNIHLIAMASTTGQELSFRYNGESTNLLELLETMRETMLRDINKNQEKPN